MIIDFDPKTYQFLQRYVVKPGNIELEVRFGKYDKEGRFRPDIGLETFTKIKQFLSSNSNIIERVEEETKSEILPNHIRRIIYTEKNLPQLRGKIKYEQKTKIYTGDVPYKDFVLRISESQEKVVQPYPAQPIEVRERDRVMYYHKNKAFYFVLTKVTSYNFLEQSNKSISYELEIEYTLKPELVRYFPDMFKDSISLLLPFIINNTDKFRYSYLPIEEENRIRYLYQSLYIKEPKPVNLSRQITPKLFSLGYTVTQKLDGERFILFFTDNGLYSFNNRKIEKYDSRNYGRLLIMDSEFFEGVYYIFDCMMYMGEKITEKSHDERLSKASEAIDKLGLGKFLKLKDFRRTSHLEETKMALKDATNYLLEHICPEESMRDIYRRLDKPTMYPENNDGLVYTSSGKYNSPIYKWKIPEKMTIDFAVYRIGSGLDSSLKKYELYVKDNIEGEPLNVPFRGNSLYEVEEAIYETNIDLKERGIYEFGYDNSTGKFILFRPRLDKIDPNFITVAQNIWNDIKNPYTKEELLELLSPVVLEDYREYQNTIKRSLIEKYCKYKSVLDLGSGRGGDLGKYDAAKVSHIWCLEPNIKNYTELLRRLSERKDMKRKTTLLKTVAQDTEKIVKGIKDSLIYTHPIVFDSIVTYMGEPQPQRGDIRPALEPQRGDKNENISYTSIEDLRNLVSWGFGLDRNNFIILDANDKVITDDDLYDSNNSNKTLKIFDTINPDSIRDDIKKQEIGGEFQNWFPKKYGIDYNKLRITDEGKYSLTKQSDSLAIIKAMQNVMGQDNLGGLTILDGTANVGGDTIRFGMNFNKVISVELNVENFDVLRNNVDVFELQNKVELINGDITKVWNDVQTFTDVLFLDPPWGGKDYRGDEEEVLNLFLSGMSISEFVGKVLLSPHRPSYIFIKLPVNYNLNSFRDMPYVSDMQVFTIRKFYLLCLIVDDRKTQLKKADILSSFFSLSFFFFKDDFGEYKDLNNLVDTIDQTLTNDGYFIGTTIDGNKTRELLNSFPDKKFDFNGGYIRFIDDEKEIVELLIRGTIVETQIESLVDFELLQTKLLDRDIELYESEIFKPGPLSEKENTLNSLYRYFVFKRKSKQNIYLNKVNLLIDEKSRPIIQSVKSGKKDLSMDDILKVLTLTSNRDNVMSSELSKCRDNHFFELLDLKTDLIGDYKLLYFNYIEDKSDNSDNSDKSDKSNKSNKSNNYLISKYHENTINYLKEYYNSQLSHENIFHISGLIDNSPLYHTKSSIIPFKEIFKYNQNVLISCIYQLYFIMMFLRKDANLQFCAPQIVLVKDNSVTSIKYGATIEITVFNGIFVKILNSSYTIDKVNVELDLPIQPPKTYDYNGIEILYYLDKHYKVAVLSNIDTCNLSYSNFLMRFLTIKNSYTNMEDNEINIIDGNPYNSYSQNDFTPTNDLYIKQSLETREEMIKDLSDIQYDYYEKIESIFSQKSERSTNSERSKNKVSTKITKWMEVLSRYMIYVDRKKTYKVLSNGYMPQMFLYALRSITDLDFHWYTNDTNDTNDTNKKLLEFKKCKNWMNIDTTTQEGIDYIDKIMSEKIDIYASYLNKDIHLNLSEQKEIFLADILTGLVSLRQNGMLMVNIKSFFTLFEISLLGYVSDMFKEFYIYKPLSSDFLRSEVFIIGRGYKRNETKIEYLKNNRINKTYPRPLNISIYSNILLAAYKFYGRQMYFMDKNMECYNYLSEKYSMDELTEDLIRKDSNKMVRYYLKMRKNIQKSIKKTIESFNFNVKKWNNYGCIAPLGLKSEADIASEEINREDSYSPIDSQRANVSDELKDDPNMEDKKYTSTKRCIGKSVFVNIVKMAHEANLMETIKDIVRRKLNFNKIPNLITALPQADSNLPGVSNYISIPGGVNLTLDMSGDRKMIESYSEIYLYKPQPELYMLRVLFVIYKRNEGKISTETSISSFKFRYNKEPKTETLVDWIVYNVSKILYDKYRDNDDIISLFKKSKNVKHLKEKGLDKLQWRKD